MRYDFPECEQAENLEMSIEDRQFMKSVSQSIELFDGHYCIDLPLKKRDVMFPNNYVVASLRSQFLKRKFKRNSAFYMDYKKIPASEIEETLAESGKSHTMGCITHKNTNFEWCLTVQLPTKENHSTHNCCKDPT